MYIYIYTNIIIYELKTINRKNTHHSLNYINRLFLVGWFHVIILGFAGMGDREGFFFVVVRKGFWKMHFGCSGSRGDFWIGVILCVSFVYFLVINCIFFSGFSGYFQ